jgi:hypothetical protein
VDGSGYADTYPTQDGTDRAFLPSSFAYVNASRGVVPGIAATAMTSGTLYVFPIWLPNAFTITSIGFAGTNATPTYTHKLFGLYDSSKNLLRSTGDDTSNAWTVNSVKFLALTSTFPTTYSGIHYLAIMVALSAGSHTMINVTNTLNAAISGTGNAAWGPTNNTGLTATLPNPFGTITQQTTGVCWGGVV